jgi:hypothetical protein
MKTKNMKKNIKKENSKSSFSQEHSNRNKKNDSIDKKIMIEHKSDKFPKNANEFKHIMDDLTCGVSDIEYMLQLRRNKKIGNISKDLSANSPSFYDTDSQKYKTKHNKKLDEKEFMKTNLGTFGYMLSDRANHAINDTQYKFETTLRSNSFNTMQRNSRNYNQKIQLKWDPTTIPKSRNLFSYFLPPILDKSKEIFNKYGNKIGRPIIPVYKEGFINGNKIRRRIFDYNKNLALRYPSEHYPSSQYQNDYGIQNIGSIRHLLDYDNKTMTSFWSTYLRNRKKLNILWTKLKKEKEDLKIKFWKKITQQKIDFFIIFNLYKLKKYLI